MLGSVRKVLEMITKFGVLEIVIMTKYLPLSLEQSLWEEGYCIWVCDCLEIMNFTRPTPMRPLLGKSPMLLEVIFWSCERAVSIEAQYFTRMTMHYSQVMMHTTTMSTICPLL